MRKAITPILSGALAIAAVFAAPQVALADIINLRASLTAAQEVPQNNSKGGGTLQATYDTSTKQLYYIVNYSGLTGRATAAHFHGPAAAGANAGIVLPVPGAIANPIKGSAILNDAQAADLVAGRWYFNIHTEANKGGEIRGQVTK